MNAEKGIALSKRLNFFPYYKALLERGLKKTTVRLGVNDRFEKNDIVTVTIGWSEDNSEPIGLARVVSVVHKKIEDLSEEDLKEESPDCRHRDAVEYVLSAIYRKVVSGKDYITVVKWENIEGEAQL